MATVIDFSEKKGRYNQWLSEASETLSGMKENIFLYMINIGTEGVWKSWNDELPLGETIEFTPEMFLNTKDKNIEALLQLYISTSEALEIIKTN